MNMCDTWAVEYWGPIEKSASKKEKKCKDIDLRKYAKTTVYK
jgi:hypothetical protein